MFSFQRHKSNIDLKWQMAQFTRYEKTSPMGAKLTNELKKKKKDAAGANNRDSGTSDMRELHQSTERTIHKMLRELDNEENPGDQEIKATQNAF